MAAWALGCARGGQWPSIWVLRLPGGEWLVRPKACLDLGCRCCHLFVRRPSVRRTSHPELRLVGGTPVRIDSWSDGCSANEKETGPNRSVIHQESDSLVQEFQYPSASGSTKQRFPLSLDHQVDPRGLPAHGVAGIGLTNPERARKLTGGKWELIKPGTPEIPAH